MGNVYTVWQFKGFVLTNTVVIQWVVMAFIIIATLLLTRNLKKVPKGSQVFVEVLVETINGLVRDNMGEKYMNFAPYIGTIFIYMLVLNILGLIGVTPPTSDYSVTLAFALMTFVIIHATALKRIGPKHYLGIYVKPYVPMLPLNIIERLVVPVSLSLRLFSNIFAGYIMMDIIYNALSGLSSALHLPIPIFEAVIPIPFHAFFDVFDGAVQMFIFIMLTMIYTKTTTEH